jgi:hypothetical protein
MAWPATGDIDTTKLDNDNDSIKESRAELYRMAGYVNDIIDAGPGPANLADNSLEIGANDSNQVQLIVRTDQSSKGLLIAARTSSTSNPQIVLNPDDTISMGGSVVNFLGIPLMPNKTTTQRDAIAPKQAGMIVFNTTTSKFQGYDGTSWNDLH